MEYGFTFKPISNVSDITVYELTAKLTEEFDELREALSEYHDRFDDLSIQEIYETPTLFHSSDRKESKLKLAHVIEEGLDVVHVIETLFRSLGVSDELLTNGYAFVNYKNALRGYYNDYPM